ncbi:MAG TPA: EVE domain-containing protein, partial [Firmicutes bacterium]|nr:EVE domain-containing protein [Bacillota bacterium]
EMTAADISLVAALYRDTADYIKQETGDPYFQYESVPVAAIEGRLGSSLEDNNSRIFVAVEQGEIVGFIAGEVSNCFLPFAPVKKIGYISGAYVTPGNRGKGVLRELEKRLQIFFQGLDLEYIELNVLSENQAGKKSWKKLGYKTFREQMRKRLMNRWLLKTEPEEYGWSDLVKEKATLWDGVRAPAALKNMRAMKKGDAAFIYHTGREKAVVGVAVVKEITLKGKESSSGAIIAAVEPLDKPVTLKEIKESRMFTEWELVRIPRLSVLPVSEEQWRLIVALSKR